MRFFLRPICWIVEHDYKHVVIEFDWPKQGPVIIHELAYYERKCQRCGKAFGYSNRISVRKVSEDL